MLQVTGAAPPATRTILRGGINASLVASPGQVLLPGRSRALDAHNSSLVSPTSIRVLWGPFSEHHYIPSSLLSVCFVLMHLCYIAVHMA